jgi:23S rRNA (uracil1939-C5)-methyltransferase
MINHLHIKDVNSKGQGVGRVQNKVVFADLALPGELVDCTIIEEKKQYIHADTTSVIEPSKERVEPPCEYYPTCGGCQLQHASYALQCRLKEKRIAKAFEKFSHHNPPLSPIITSPSIWEYRHKISMPLNYTNGCYVTGLYRRNSHDLVPITHCMLHNSTGEQLLSSIRQWLQTLSNPHLRHLMIRTSSDRKEASLLLIGTTKASSALMDAAKRLRKEEPTLTSVVYHHNTRKDNVLLDQKFTLLDGSPYIHDHFMGFAIRLSYDAFFQVNTKCAQLLYTKAVSMANLSASDIVLDAYCGIGLLGMLSSKIAQKVVGVESIPSALEDAQFHCKAIPNIAFHVGYVEKVFAELDDPFTTCFLNPPRKGCDLSLLNSIKGVKKIVYISCHPESLARDVAHLLEQGYHLKQVQPVDMFPQTTHVETIALLER